VKEAEPVHWSALVQLGQVKMFSRPRCLWAGQRSVHDVMHSIFFVVTS